MHEIEKILIVSPIGINDNFFLTKFGSGEWSLNVYNRWGKTLYEDDQFNGYWNDIEVPDNIYYYTINDKYCKQYYKGWLQIVR